ncbi:MAG: 4Fe-4S dicluster domain-containing protein [Chloroflexota bacterium]
MKKIARSDIGRLLARWQEQYSVLVPSAKSGTLQMAPWEGEDLSLDAYRNTSLPPKARFLPLRETLFAYRKTADGIALDLPGAPTDRQLLFGIRPCDARAAAMVDLVFRDTYPDSAYLERRRNTVLVGLGCTRPSGSCFCTSLGIDPSASPDVDVMLTDTGDAYLMEAVSPLGEELLANGAELADATPDDETKARECREESRTRIKRQINVEGVAKKLREVFEDREFWEKAAAKCISCGICTFLCPTCYCFDINDEADPKDGSRWRHWDSCSFSLYTRMPVENPREEKWQRVRQKVSHKYLFYPELFHLTACTGCGRCIRLCPVNWDITRVLASLPEKTGKEGKG